MWHAHVAWFCPLWFLAFALLIWAVFVRNRRCGARYWDKSEVILKERLAKGEIDEAEYQKLKDALRK